MPRPKFFLPNADRRLGNRYELLECLGDGSYGWVWRAQRLADDRIIALKIPKAQGDGNDDLAEGTALIGREPHPNVVSVYWMGRIPPERQWYAIEMEYFPSTTLSKLLDSGDQGFVTSYDRILTIYDQILSGVAHLHSLPMSHGDIKPQNVLVSGDQVKLTDFGCSVLPDEMYVRTRENGGTILYSAPEVAGSGWRRRDSDAFLKADIYSLGVLLYHLVTSRLPHDTLSQVIRHVPFPRPREVNTTISPSLEEFILRCLEMEPENRWPSTREMLAAFRTVRRSQLEYNPVRPLPRAMSEYVQDWSSLFSKLMEAGDYAQAENIAAAEYEASNDSYAFSSALEAASRDGRYFDCLRMLNANPDMLKSGLPAQSTIRQLALDCYIETREIARADKLIDECIRDEGRQPGLLLRKASVLGLQAKYEGAAEILLGLNREHPGKPSILKRLTLVFEQSRDTGKASAFLRAYAKIAPNDPWAQRKLEQYSALGLI